MGGTILTLRGENFGSTDASVLVGDGLSSTPVLCNIVPGNWTHTEINCTLETGLGFHLPVVVTVGGQASNSSVEFSFDAYVRVSLQRFLQRAHCTVVHLFLGAHPSRTVSVTPAPSPPAAASLAVPRSLASRCTTTMTPCTMRVTQRST